MMTTHIHFRAYLALGLGILCIGFSAIFVRWANAPGAVTAFYRMGIATVVLAWPFFRRVNGGARLSRRGLKFAVLGGLFFAGDLALWTEGVNRSGATNPTLLANTAPLWVGLGAGLLFRERQPVRFWGGLLLAMAGAALVLGLDAAKGFALGLGTFFGLLAGVFYGGYFLATQRGRESLDVLAYFWPAAATSAVVLLGLGLAWGQPFWGYSAQTYWNFLGLGVLTQTLGWLAVNYAQGYLPASLVAPTLLGQPVLTALLAVPLLGEGLSFWQVVGGLTVLAGVYAVHRSRRNGGW